jgi:hypothetical protein
VWLTRKVLFAIDRFREQVTREREPKPPQPRPQAGLLLVQMDPETSAAELRRPHLNRGEPGLHRSWRILQIGRLAVVIIALSRSRQESHAQQPPVSLIFVE